MCNTVILLSGHFLTTTTTLCISSKNSGYHPLCLSVEHFMCSIPYFTLYSRATRFLSIGFTQISDIQYLLIRRYACVRIYVHVCVCIVAQIQTEVPFQHRWLTHIRTQYIHVCISLVAIAIQIKDDTRRQNSIRIAYRSVLTLVSVCVAC